MDMILSMLQKQLHHQLDDVSIEEVLGAMNQIASDIGVLQCKMDTLKGNQQFLQDLLLKRLKDGVG